MKKLTLASCTMIALALTAAVALADTWTQFDTAPSASGDDTCNITATGDANSTVTIPASATITAYGSDGEPITPNIPLHISPSKGTPGHTIIIKKSTIPPSNFAPGTYFKISSIDSNVTTMPSSSWSNNH